MVCFGVVFFCLVEDFVCFSKSKGDGWSVWPNNLFPKVGIGNNHDNDHCLLSILLRLHYCHWIGDVGGFRLFACCVHLWTCWTWVCLIPCLHCWYFPSPSPLGATNSRSYVRGGIKVLFFLFFLFFFVLKISCGFSAIFLVIVGFDNNSALTIFALLDHLNEIYNHTWMESPFKCQSYLFQEIWTVAGFRRAMACWHALFTEVYYC